MRKSPSSDIEGSNRRPYAYVTGGVEFFYLPFRTDERALVPRLETESLVREALSVLRSSEYSVVVDVGTGSGIIAVSIAKNRADLRTIALDLSVEALSLARENAEKNGVRVDFFHSDLLSGLPEIAQNEKGVCFVANLPYVKIGAEVSEDTAFEPQMALYGWAGTGFELTERFLGEVEEFAASHRKTNVAVVCEVGHDQDSEIERMARKFGRDVRKFADLTGTERFFTYRIWPS